MALHEPDIGSIVTRVKGPNMVYYSKENVSVEENKMMLLQKRNCSRVSEPVIWFCHQVIGARPSVNISDERKKNNLRKTLVF